MINLNEKVLVQALREGQIEAFDALYYKYHKKLFAFIYKFLKNWHDSEDLVQKLFVIIWERKETIDPEKSFNSFIFTIARNEAYDILKKKVLVVYCNDYIISNTVQSNEDTESKRMIEIIYSLIKKIPERRRQIFLLSREHGLTYKQIASKLNISENTVDTQIRNSLNYLRKELPKYLKLLIILIKTPF